MDIKKLSTWVQQMEQKGADTIGSSYSEFTTGVTLTAYVGDVPVETLEVD